MAIQGFTGGQQEPRVYPRHRLRLRSTHDGQETDIHCFSFPGFRASLSSPRDTDAMRVLKEFRRNHPLADRSLLDGHPSAPPRILVGADQYFKVASVGAELPLEGGLVARKTLLGWVVSGSANFATSCYTATNSIRSEIQSVVAVCCATSATSAAADLARLWQLEEMGIKDPDPEPNLSADDAQAVHQFKSSLRHDGGTYTVAVPKKPSITTLNNNKSVAAKRLQSKIADLKRAEGSYERYDREINAFIEGGHAIEIHDVDEKAMDAVDGSYYMPHHQVVSERDGKTKWRVVFDCSSHRPGRSSLNEHLLVGPNVNPDLLAMLLSFRAHQIAVSAGIAQAYLCIRIAEENQRFF